MSPCLRVSVTRRGDTRERWIVAVVAIVALMWALPDRAFAQQRPLVTEDPETIGAGRILLEGGLDYAHDADYPASGLEGNLLRALVVGVSVGLSSIAEVQIDGGFHNRLDITLESGDAISLWWLNRSEWEGLIEVAGFEVEALYGGFERQPFDENATEFVWVVRKP